MDRTLWERKFFKYQLLLYKMQGEIRMGMDTLEQQLLNDSLPQVQLPKDTVPAGGETPLVPARQDSSGVREVL